MSSEQAPPPNVPSMTAAFEKADAAAGERVSKEATPRVAPAPDAERPAPIVKTVEAEQPKHLRDEAGKFAKKQEQTAETKSDATAAKAADAAVDAGAQPVADSEHLLEIEGPWGKEVLDTRKAEDRKRLKEWGQKGKNYDRHMADFDAKVQARATEREQMAVAREYVRLGLAKFTASGQLEWTPRGVDLLSAQTRGETGNSPQQTPAPSAAQPDGEEDNLVRAVLKADTEEEAAKALKTLLKRARDGAVTAGTEAARADSQRVLSDREAKTEADRRQKVALDRFEAETKKHPVFAEDPSLLHLARSRVGQKFRALDEAHKRGEAVPTEEGALLDLAMAEVGEVARERASYDQRVIDRHMRTVAAPKREAPPATGAGAAAPPAPASEKDKKPLSFKDGDFEERVLARVRSRGGAA